MTRAEFIELAIGYLHHHLSEEEQTRFRKILETDTSAQTEFDNLVAIREGLAMHVSTQAEYAWTLMEQRLFIESNGWRGFVQRWRFRVRRIVRRRRSAPK